MFKRLFETHYQKNKGPGPFLSIYGNTKTLEQTAITVWKIPKLEAKRNENPQEYLKDYYNSDGKEQKSKSCFAGFASHSWHKTQVVEKVKTLDAYSIFNPIFTNGPLVLLCKHSGGITTERVSLQMQAYKMKFYKISKKFCIF